MFFKNWYILKLYDCEPENYNESGLMNDYTKMIQYMKRFLLHNTVIDPPPTSSYLALSTWSIQIDAIAKTCERAMVEWLEANRELWYTTRSGDSSTRQMRELFSSALRALRNIKLQDIPLAKNVVDSCTKAERQAQ